jgi:DNA-directed RNA polymerase subunit K/omega
MQVFTPADVSANAVNKYLAVLVAAQYARALNEFPRLGGTGPSKKLTTRALEELSGGNIAYRIVARRRGE